ncbi:hypothetical protein FRC05_010272 [Tulasnella sp. 425]|nr:hypothetical protein FRC05_010272 [Tulasnella sp. 425]
MTTGPATATTHLNSPSAAAFGALGFGHPMMMDGGLGLLQSTTNDLDPAGTLSEMFEGQLSLAGVDRAHRETNLKSISDGGWICRSPRPHDMPLTTTSSNPSTPPRSASSSSSTFSFPPSPSSTASFGSGPGAFMYPKQQQQLQQNNSPVGAPLRLQGTSGALSGGTSLGLMMGGKTLYSTPPPPSLHLPPFQNPNGMVGQLGGGGIGPTTPQVLPLPALPPHLLPARLGGTGNGVTQPQPQSQSQQFLLQNTTTPQLTNNPLLNLTALTNILAPSGLRLSQGGRVRNVCPDASNPILMFWPDNEPLPVLGQCRPPLPPDFSKNGSGARDGESARAAASGAVGGVGDANEVRKANGLPPILNTGNVGPMEKQPLDWTCGVCKYINWRRRKVCQCCFPYAPGNEPPANHEDKLKIISALLTSSGASASSAPSASLPLGPAGMFNSATSSAFNPTPAPHSFAPTMNTNATTPPSLAQHQLFQQLQRDQHQLLQMQLQLQIQKAQAQLTLFTQQQQQQLQQRQGFGGGVGTLGLGGVAGNGGMVGWNNNSVPSSASASSSEMGSSRAGSPFVLGNKSAALTNLAPIMNSGLLAKPTTPMSTSAAAPTQSSPSPLSIFSATSGTKKSIWAMDGGSSTPVSSASGSPSSTARSSPTSFNNAVDPEATVKLGSAVWFGSGAVSQNPAGAAVIGNRFGEIGSGKAPQFLPGAFGGAGVARKASLPMSQIGAGGAATFGSSSSGGSPTGLGNASFFSSSSSSSLPSLNGPRTPVSGMATPGTGSFGIGNGGSALF